MSQIAVICDVIDSWKVSMPITYIIGMKMTRVIGFRLLIRSFGIPLSFIVAD